MGAIDTNLPSTPFLPLSAVAAPRFGASASPDAVFLRRHVIILLPAPPYPKRPRSPSVECHQLVSSAGERLLHTQLALSAVG